MAHFATATVVLDLDAHIAGDVLARENISVSAVSENFADAEAGGIGGAGIAGVGVSEATATIGGTQVAYLGGINAETGIDVSITNLATNEADADVQSLQFGLLGAANTNIAVATVDPTLTTSIQSGANVTAGDDVLVRGQALADAHALTDGVTVAGLVSYDIGASSATALLDSDVNSFIGTADVTGRFIRVKAFHNTAENGPTGNLAEAIAHASGGAGGVALEWNRRRGDVDGECQRTCGG